MVGSYSIFLSPSVFLILTIPEQVSVYYVTWRCRHKLSSFALNIFDALRWLVPSRKYETSYKVVVGLLQFSVLTETYFKSRLEPYLFLQTCKTCQQNTLMFRINHKRHSSHVLHVPGHFGNIFRWHEAKWWARFFYAENGFQAQEKIFCTSKLGISSSSLWKSTRARIS